MTAPLVSPRPKTPLLDRVSVPEDLRNFSAEQLKDLAEELRAETIDAVSVTGGHLGASLGVVELTVAMHAVFETPRDRLVWDVGHQAYPHKILTGRRDRIRTLRQGDGLSGFTRRAESEYDPFGAAHSSTSISADARHGGGARSERARTAHVVAVIGDGAMSAGMAYEAMNNAGARHSRLIVILNDNDMSIAPPVGAMSAYLSRLLSSQRFLSLRELAARDGARFPGAIERTARRAEEFARGILTGGTLFEELGFYYRGADRRPQPRPPAARAAQRARGGGERADPGACRSRRRARATRRPRRAPTSCTRSRASTSSPASRRKRRPARRPTRACSPMR